MENVSLRPLFLTFCCAPLARVRRGRRCGSCRGRTTRTPGPATVAASGRPAPWSRRLPMMSPAHSRLALARYRVDPRGPRCPRATRQRVWRRQPWARACRPPSVCNISSWMPRRPCWSSPAFAYCFHCPCYAPNITGYHFRRESRAGCPHTLTVVLERAHERATVVLDVAASNTSSSVFALRRRALGRPRWPRVSR